MAKNPVARIDALIKQLGSVHAEAQQLFDEHCHELRHQCPGIPPGVLMQCEITGPSGLELDYRNALLLLREKFTKGATN